MKKALLLLVFLLCYTTYGQQPPGLLDPYNICDDGTIDGYATFNLVSTDPIGMLGLDPASYTITFHPSVADANNNVNTIANPTAYINAVPNYQTIGIRFLNTLTSEVNTSGMELNVFAPTTPTFISSVTICSGDNATVLPTTSLDGITGTWSPAINNTITTTYTFTPDVGQCATSTSLTMQVMAQPTANQASLTFCDPLELPIYYLPNANGQITGGQSDLTVSCFLTLADAQNNTNPLEVSFIPTVNPGSQVLYTRVTNPSGCTNFSTLTLNTENCSTTCNAPTQLTSIMVTPTSALLGWTSNNLETTQWQVYLVPEGAPAPTAASGGITALVNPFLVTGLTPGLCYTFYVRSRCNFNLSVWSEWSAPKNYCYYYGGCDSNTCYSAGLMAFLDTNNNGTKEPNELPFYGGHYEYQINDSGIIQYGYPSETNAYFTLFDSNPANSYDISYVLNDPYSNYYNCNATQSNVILTNLGNAEALPFAVTQSQPFTDALVTSYPIEQPRPGFNYTNVFSFKNNSSSTIAEGNLTFTKDAILSISSVSGINGAVTTANGFNYAFTNLLPNQSIFFSVTFTVPSIPTVEIGQLVTNTLVVQVANDAIAANNATVLTQAIIGAYDPNNLIESHGEKIVFTNFSTNDYLYYTINFENTGTAEALFVSVENTLDSKLDESTFEMLDANHTVSALRNGNQLTWRFYDINLPPTATNPTNSHGYITYRIKPKPGYALGDIIPNTASIYFDTNPAIVTNTFNTEFVAQLSTGTFTANGIILAPNPSTNKVQITNTLNEPISTIALYEVSGKQVKVVSGINQTQSTVDLENLAKGVYFVEITTASNTKQIKKLIIQ